jgi:hypothetical protein
MSQPIGIDVIADKRGGLVAQGSYAVWCAMVEAAWCGTLASMSLLLQRTVDEPTVALLLQGVLRVTRLYDNAVCAHGRNASFGRRQSL